MKDLAIETANSFTKLPKFLISALLTFIIDSIEKKAHFNINELNIVDYVKVCQMPAIFITSHEDTFVDKYHVEKLYDNYLGKKFIKYIMGIDFFFYKLFKFSLIFEKNFFNDIIKLRKS